MGTCAFTIWFLLLVAQKDFTNTLIIAKSILGYKTLFQPIAYISLPQNEHFQLYDNFSCTTVFSGPLRVV